MVAGLLVLLVALIALAGGLAARLAAPSATTTDADLVVLDWSNDIPAAVLEDFARQRGITVRRVLFKEPDEGNRLLEQSPAYDVAVIEYPYIRPLAEAGKLQPLNLRAIPNFRFVDPAFRNLAFDPANRYSVPFSWGAIGILALDGVFTGPDVQWGDLWDTDLGGGKLVLWTGFSRHLMAATLKRLGYSANSQDPAALAAARAALLDLRPRVLLFDSANYQDYLGPALQGQIRATVADTAAYASMHDFGLPVRFYFPRDGALIWGDSLVIPARSRNPRLAAELINYLLDPQVSARIMEGNHLRSANEAAVQYAAPATQTNDVLFPDLETLRRAELVLPLNQESQAIWDAAWSDFLEAQAPGRAK